MNSQHALDLLQTIVRGGGTLDLERGRFRVQGNGRVGKGPTLKAALADWEKGGR